MELTPIPTLDALADEPSRAAALAPEAAVALLARCAVVQGALTSAVLASTATRPADAPTSERLLSIPAVAEVLAVPPSYAYELARQGRLPTVRLGKYVRVRVADLPPWLAHQAARPLDGGPAGAILGNPSRRAARGGRSGTSRDASRSRRGRAARNAARPADAEPAPTATTDPDDA